MADIDSLEIEISAESSDAAQKVNSLAEALERLKSAISGGAFDNIGKHIRGVGDGAQQANTQIAKRKQAMRNVAERVKGPAQTPEVSAKGLAGMEKQLKALGAEFDAALDKADQLRTQLDISRSLRPISDVEKAQYSAATQEVEKLSNSYHELEERIKAVKSANAEKAAGVDASTTQAVENVAKNLEVLSDVSEKVSQTKMEGPSIDAGVTAEIENATRQIEELGEVAEKVDNVQVEVGGQMSGQFSGISQADLTKDINQAFPGTQFSGKVGEISSLVKEINNVSSAASSASSFADSLGTAFQNAGESGTAAMGQLSGSVSMGATILKTLLNKQKENQEFLASNRSFWTDSGLNDLPGLGQKAAATLLTIQPQLKAVVYAMRSLIQPGQELLGILGELAGNGFKNAGNALKNFASSGFEKAGNAMKSMVTGIGDGIKSIGANVGKKLVQPFTGAIAAIQKWKESLGRMAFYKAITTAINTVTNGLKTGMDNLYKFSQMADGKFAASMDSLASSSMYLSNSLGSMAAPLINAVAPAIDFIIGKIVSLINMLGALFAVISGAGSFTQAKKQAVSYGDAIGGAAGAAKELQDYVLGIDELNIIKENAGGGGGGGGGGMGFEDMFEEVPLPDWAKEMQDAINRGDWYGAGEILAEHLNKIVEDWNSEAWGQMLGDKINHGLDFALGFLRKFNFDELGKKLAEAVNGIGDSLNFDTLGRVIGAGWNAVFETANGFFKRLDWKMWGRNIAEAINGFVDEINWALIGQTISNGIVGLFTMADEAIRGIKWEEIGRSLATMLNNVNWYGIAYTGLLTILDGIKGAARAIETFAKEFKWDAVATQISGGINHALYTMSESEWKQVGASIGLLFTKAFGFARDVISGIDWPQLGRDLAALLEGVQWGSLLEAVGGALAAGFNAVIDTAYEIVSKDSFWSKLGSGVFTGVQTFFNNLKIDKALDGLSLAVTRAINLAIDAINGLVQADTFWTNLGNGIKTGISNFFNKINPPEVVSAITGLLQRVIDAGVIAVSELASHGDWWTELGTSIGNGINDLVKNTDWKTLLTSLAKLATDILNGLSAALKAINWDEAWQTIKEALDAVEWGPLVEAAMGFFAEAFKAKMEMKLLGIKLFFTIGGKIGGELIDGIMDGLKDIPIVGWFITLGETLFKHAGNIATTIGKIESAIWTGNWGEIGRIVQEGWDNANRINEECGVDLVDNTSKIGLSVQEKVGFHSGGAASEVEGAGRKIKTDWRDALDQALKDTQEKGAGIKDTATGKFMEMQGELFKTMGTIGKDVETGWTNTETTTNTKWNSIGSFLNTTWSGLQTAADIGFTAMSTSVKDNWDAAETKSTTSWNAQDTLLKGIWSDMETTSKTAFENIYSTVDTNWTNANTSTTTNWGNIVTTTDAKAGEALTAVKTNFNQVSGAVTSGLEAAKTAANGVDFKGVGENIVNGVSAGVRAKAGELAQTVSTSIFQAAEAARRAAQIHSPSRLFRDDVGVYIGLGIAEGVEESQKDILTSIMDVNSRMEDAFSTAITGVWNAMESNVKKVFSRIVYDMADSMHEGYTRVLETWEGISNVTAAQTSGLSKIVFDGLFRMVDAVSASLSRIKQNVATMDWGSVGANMVRGMTAGVNAAASQLAASVSNAARTAVSAAKAALGIHSPSTVMRDMIGVNIGLGIAEGIQYSTRDIVSSIYDVNAQMKAAFDPGAFPSPEDMTFPVHEDFSASYQVEYTYDSQHEEDTAKRFTEGVRVANEDVVNALYTLGAQLIDAMNNADNQPRVYLDGKEIMQSTEKHQRQRGANIFGGGVYQT